MIISVHRRGILVERLFPDQKLVLLRYAIIHMGEINGGREILQDNDTYDSSGKTSDARQASAYSF